MFLCMRVNFGSKSWKPKDNNQHRLLKALMCKNETSCIPAVLTVTRNIIDTWHIINRISILLIRVLSLRYYYTQWHMEGEQVVCLCHLTTKHHDFTINIIHSMKKEKGHTNIMMCYIQYNLQFLLFYFNVCCKVAFLLLLLKFSL